MLLELDKELNLSSIRFVYLKIFMIITSYIFYAKPNNYIFSNNLEFKVANNMLSIRESISYHHIISYPIINVSVS